MTSDGEAIRAKRTPNERLRDHRKLRGWSQQDLVNELLAKASQVGERHLGLTFKQVSRWEQGWAKPRPPYTKLLCLVFETSARELGLHGPPSQPDSRHDLLRTGRRGVSVSSGDAPAGPVPLPESMPESVASVLEETTADHTFEITPALAIRLAHEWLIAEPPQSVEVQAGRRIGKGLIGAVERRVEQLRRMDDFIGGNDLYELVAKELRATILILKEAEYGETLGRRLLTTVGELSQLAGWTAADAGLSALAWRHYAGGIHAAHMAANVPLAANLISLMGYLSSNEGDTREGVLLAHTAHAGARNRSSATTQALLQERIAWAHARAGELRQTQRALGEADLAYERHDPADDPAWVYWLNRDEMDVMAGRCYTELGQPRQAAPLLRAVLDRYNEEHVRETLLYSTWLAESYVQAEDIDEASAQATRALILSTRVNSARGKERVKLLRHRLGPYLEVRSAREFDGLYRELEAS